MFMNACDCSVCLFQTGQNNNAIVNRNAVIPIPHFSSGLPSSARKNNENVNQSAAIPSRYSSSSFSNQSSPYSRHIILDKLLPEVPLSAGMRAINGQSLGKFEKVKKHAHNKTVQRLPKIGPLSSSLKKSLNDFEVDVKGESRVSETVCSMPPVKPTFPGQSTEKAGMDRKKKECVTSLPEIRKSSGKFITPPLYAAESFEDGFDKLVRELSSKVLRPHEQKLDRLPKLNTLSSSRKAGCAKLEKGVLKRTKGTSKSTGIKLSVDPVPKGKSTKKTEVDGINNQVHTTMPSEDDSAQPTSQLGSPRRSVAGTASGSETESAFRSEASSEACSRELKFKNSQKRCRNSKIKRGAVASESNLEEGVQLGDKLKSQTSDMQLVENRPKSQTSDVQLVMDRPQSQSSDAQLDVDRPKSQTSNKQLVVGRPKSQTSDVQLVVGRPKSQTSDVQLVVVRPKSQTSDVQQVEERSKSQTSAVQVMDRPICQTCEIQLDRPESETSDIPLVDRSESQTPDELECRFSDKGALSAVSACSTHSLQSLDDGGNTTDDAEDLPESDSDEFSPDRLSLR